MNGNRGQYNSAPLYKINKKRGAKQGEQPDSAVTPAVPRQNRAMDTVLSVIMSIPLPILFLLALLISSRPLRLTFLLLAAAAVAVMWIMRSFVRSARSTLTVVYGALAAVIVVALIVSPGTVSRTAAPVSSSALNQTAGYITGNTQSSVTGPTAQETEPPTDQQAAAMSATEERLLAFFQAWGTGSAKDMLAYCVPSWVNQQQNPEETLFNMILDSMPRDYQFESVDGSEGDSSRIASVKAHFHDLNGNVTYKRVRVFMQKVNNEWYINPDSLSGVEINEAAEAAQSVTVHVNTTIAPTATPATNTSGVKVYYNPDGGQYYHGKQNCPDVNQKYWPLTEIPYEMLNSQQYKGLLRCPNPECGAPERPPLQ